LKRWNYARRLRWQSIGHPGAIEGDEAFLHGAVVVELAAGCGGLDHGVLA
jgi:hypothetical protein